jgi:hypothetical protein
MSYIERIIRIMIGNLVQIELREGTTCVRCGPIRMNYTVAKTNTMVVYGTSKIHNG